MTQYIPSAEVTAGAAFVQVAPDDDNPRTYYLRVVLAFLGSSPTLVLEQRPDHQLPGGQKIPHFSVTATCQAPHTPTPLLFRFASIELSEATESWTPSEGVWISGQVSAAFRCFPPVPTYDWPRNAPLHCAAPAVGRNDAKKARGRFVIVAVKAQDGSAVATRTFQTVGLALEHMEGHIYLSRASDVQTANGYCPALYLEASCSGDATSAIMKFAAIVIDPFPSRTWDTGDGCYFAFGTPLQITQSQPDDNITLTTWPYNP